jgi:hypothetical protein
MIKQYIFRDKRTHIQKNSKKWKSIATRTMEHVFAIEEDSEGNIWFG